MINGAQNKILLFITLKLRNQHAVLIVNDYLEVYVPLNHSLSVAQP